MLNNLTHKWQIAIKVISELLCETKRITEQCSIGTSNDNARLDSIQAEWARERIPGPLLLPKSYCAEILKEAEEFTSNKAMQEWVMRVMFRSVWDTAYCIKTLAETFINTPNLISTRNICVMQRDLIDKIIDIPFIHRSGRGQQYLEFRSYVSSPQKMLHLLPYLLPDVIRHGGDKLDMFLESLVTLFDARFSVIRHSKNEMDATLAVIKDLIKLHADTVKLRDSLDNAIQHGEEEVQALKDSVQALIEDLMRKSMNQLIATFVEKYYPDWGNWIELSPAEQQKKLHNQLRSWTKLKHKTKLRDGLLQYVDEDFYNLDAIGFTNSYIKEQCERLPFAYHIHSLYVHDSIENSIHREQGWEESSSDYELWATLGICAFAIYVAAAHYYDCAEMCDEMEHLQRIIRDNPIDRDPLYL